MQGGVDHGAHRIPPRDPVVHSYFKREVGALAGAHAQFGQVLKQPASTSPTAQRGIRFEKKVLGFLTSTFGIRFSPGLPFAFQELCGKHGRAVPDGLLFSPDWRSVTVIEVKLRHTGDAWFQLNKFYLPIVRRAFPALQVSGLEICALYDPVQRLPQPVSFVRCASEAEGLRSAFHPVMVFTEREARQWKDG